MEVETSRVVQGVHCCGVRGVSLSNRAEAWGRVRHTEEEEGKAVMSFIDNIGQPKGEMWLLPSVLSLARSTTH